MRFEETNLNFIYGFKCNYSCIGCSTGSNVIDSSTQDPDFDKIINSVKTASKLFNVNSMITLLGGEPFLYWHSRIVPLVLEINKYFPKKRINITTNGQLIGKNIDNIFKLAQQVDELSITVSRHLIGIDDATIKKTWDQNINEFLSHPMVVKIHDDHYHIKDNIHANIYFFQADTWKSYYYHTADQKIKPWATNDPEKSVRYGCTGIVCSTLYENKLFKCNNLATLSTHLQSLGQLNDPDWKKYIEYPYIDIDAIDEDLYKDFVQSYGKPTTWCDMCNNDPLQNIPWKQRTFPMVFSKTVKTN
jgi:organic radical activating enzyme